MTKVYSKTNSPRVHADGTKYKKVLTQEMKDRVKGSRRHLRIKAVIIDILKDGDALTTAEIWNEITEEYSFKFYESINFIGALCAKMPQVESLGTELVSVRDRAYYDKGTYKKPQRVWALRKI